MSRVWLSEPHHAVHDAIRVLWLQMNRQIMSQEALSTRSGVPASVLSRWRTGERSPKLDDVEASLNVLGYTLVAVPIEREGC